LKGQIGRASKDIAARYEFTLVRLGRLLDPAGDCRAR